MAHGIEKGLESARVREYAAAKLESGEWEWADEDSGPISMSGNRHCLFMSLHAAAVDLCEDHWPAWKDVANHVVREHLGDAADWRYTKRNFDWNDHECGTVENAIAALRLKLPVRSKPLSPESR